ncbi:MAG: hypothetical protein KatS3mg131_0945 [Candidatus Tectimicrobiota bacterium]|nr:MAG: hypothetical protein KatS3mg131_0945 [Candidatus Tectomicrobia bacterium]
MASKRERLEALIQEVKQRLHFPIEVQLGERWHRVTIVQRGPPIPRFNREVLGAEEGTETRYTVSLGDDALAWLLTGICVGFSHGLTAGYTASSQAIYSPEQAPTRRSN